MNWEIKCKKCNETKHESLFSRSSRNKNGLRQKCKECEAKYHREYYNRTPQVKKIAPKKITAQERYENFKKAKEAYDLNHRKGFTDAFIKMNPELFF